MRKKITKYQILTAIIVFLALTISCSTDKNTAVNRTYHNLTAKYNVFFNAKEAYKSGMKKIDAEHKENYTLLIPVFKYSDKETARIAFGDMNRTIEKASKCVHKHSITKKPKHKPGKKPSAKDKEFRKKPEFVKWIDDSYLLIGKANFIKGDYFPSIENFNFIIREYSDNPIKYEAYLWLARTYTEMGKYDKANDFISKIETDKQKVPESLYGPVAITKADILIHQELYAEATKPMEIGIKNTKKKHDKARYWYLQGQLHQQLDENKKAYDAYGKVIDMNPDYQMTFNARINRASIFNSSSGDSKALQKQLSKMLKDDKNIDYRDQIYYALGNIAINESREDDAIAFYKLSTKASTENTYQKSLSYLSIADIYFDKPDYREAQVYYDSTVTYLDSEHPEYNDIKIKNQNLNVLVKNLNVIYTQDSLQRVALMPESERNVIIDKIIEDLIEEERRQQELEQERQRDMMYAQQESSANQSSGGKWYFYNPAMISSGQAEFRTKWGERKNEDNWRRKNKTELNVDEITEEGAAEDSSKNAYSDKTREFYLVDLPLSDSSIQISDSLIEQAYFNIATVYYEKFKDYNQSIEEYATLLNKYPETAFTLSSYYNLYKLYSFNNKISLSNEYKQRIIDEFPDSDYAKILLNPEYYKELEAIENQVNFIYQATYKYFLNDECVDVRNNFEFVDSAFSQSKLIPKFALLNTLCEGRKGDSAAFKIVLTNFIADYPGTEEIAYAQDVLYALDRETREVELRIEEERKSEFGGDITDVSMNDSLDVSMYKFDPKQTHYYVVVVNNEKANEKVVEFNIKNFNIDYFSFLSFEVETELLSASYNNVKVGKFKNKKMASNYYESVIIADEVLNKLEDDEYRAFIFSESNYTLFLKDKSIARYQQFFEQHYTQGFDEY